jgi:tetratricopeptide (TPR) repeat protein
MRAIIALTFLICASVLFGQKEFSATGDLAAAKQSYLNGKFDQAVAALDRFHKAGGSTVQSLDLRGCIYMEQGKLDDAGEAFQSAHLSNFDAFSPRIHYADVMLYEKKFADARREYEKLQGLTKTAIWLEYLRFGVLLAYFGEHDEAGAHNALRAIVFPTETPAYYYAQAASAFSHGNKAEARKWLNTARKIFDSTKTGWFDRALYQFGWLKDKPAPSIDPFA